MSSVFSCFEHFTQANRLLYCLDPQQIHLSSGQKHATSLKTHFIRQAYRSPWRPKVLLWRLLRAIRTARSLAPTHWYSANLFFWEGPGLPSSSSTIKGCCLTTSLLPKTTTFFANTNTNLNNNFYNLLSGQWHLFFAGSSSLATSETTAGT